MRKGIGFTCIALGLVCLIIALGFVVYNAHEAKTGEKTAQALLQNVQQIMNQESPGEVEPLAGEVLPESQMEACLQEMQTIPAGSYESIGIVSIPVLELELPVLTDWSYEKLKNAPCHYFGSCYQSDFVIAAHNYPSHFGRLSQLQKGDLVIFTDVTGVNHCYEVVLLETLSATATEEMITSGFDLSLYTCTPGGNNRVTVRCTRITDG